MKREIDQVLLSPGDSLYVHFAGSGDDTPSNVVVIKYHNTFDQVEVIHEPTSESCDLTYFFQVKRQSRAETSYPLRATKQHPAEQCRELGISVGDSIESYSDGGSPVQLTLVWLGKRQAVWLKYVLNGDKVWTDAEEVCNWSLSARYWRILPRAESKLSRGTK